MKPNMTINIAQTFSKAPAGRYESDGPTSGQVFREKVLLPALSEAECVEIVLDGTEGYGSSFLDEAFGGLLRDHGFSAAEFTKRIKFVSDEDPSFIEEIMGYVQDEDKRQDRKSRPRVKF